MGYDDLGQHHHRTGDLVNSTKSYARMRDYCTTPSHIVIMNLRLISVSIDQGNWLAVQTNVQKLRTPGQKIADTERLSAKLSAAMGLALLSSNNYYEAALEFIGADPRMIQARLDDATDEEAFNEVMTPNDVAIYGGLCALASMNRNDLQKKVLDNNTFRNYLELEPHIRRAIASFVSSKYSSCLSILESYRTDYLLDLHLHRHLAELYFQIRSKAIQQYFIPFSRVTLSALATAFNTDEQTMEAEVTGMIKRGHLDGRIDLVDRVLCATSVDARRKVHKEALSMAQDYERTAHLRILKLEMTNAGLEVMDKSKGGGPLSVDNVTGDRLYGSGAMNQWLGDGNGGGGGKLLRSSLRG